jgi:hypothetical protein
VLRYIPPVVDDPLLQAMVDALDQCQVAVSVFQPASDMFWPLRYKDDAAFAVLKQGGSILAKHMMVRSSEL